MRPARLKSQVKVQKEKVDFSSVVPVAVKSVVSVGELGEFGVFNTAGSGAIFSSVGYVVTNHHVTDELGKVMVKTNDGFEIAEIDLKLRGPGDIEGTQQSGIAFDLKIANLGQDGQILQYARDVAERILDKDPLLSSPQNQPLINQLKKLTKRKFDWSAIS